MRENHPNKQQFIKEESKKTELVQIYWRTTEIKYKKHSFNFQVETCQSVETN
jgi:hypothetical protein